MGSDLFCFVFVALLAGVAGTTAYTAAEQTSLLNEHNTHRTGVSTEASNMNKMEWDSGLASQAQTWADKCLFYHPNKTVYTEYASLGQNLYIQYPDASGTNPPTVTKPVTKWYNETEHYYYSYNACVTGKVCGHYTQIIWADTTKLGCGIKFCSTAVGEDDTVYTDAWLVACNYSPPGNYNGESPYESGNHCSKCSDGKYCQNKLCTACDTSDSTCECKIECQNCGTKSATDCTCTCPTGYFGTNCETFCENTNAYCGANPGYPASWCGVKSFVDERCPLMCGYCTAGPEYTGGTCN